MWPSWPKWFLSTPKVSGSNSREAPKFSKTILNISRPIISSVHPTRRTRVISSRFNRDIVTARELCQVSWLRITLAGKARKKGPLPTSNYNHYYSKYRLVKWSLVVFRWGPKYSGRNLFINLCIPARRIIPKGKPSDTMVSAICCCDYNILKLCYS